MAKRKRKKKLSRRERKAHPERVASQPTAQPAANIPEPEAESPMGSQPETEAAQPVPVTATFKPADPQASSTAAQSGDQAEYTAVKKDLRKLWLSIAALILIIAGLAVWDAQTDVIGQLGNAMFSWWQ